MSKSVEETYLKLSPIEHVLKRPGMYIGDVKKNIEEQWVFDDKNKKMIKKFVEYSPGFIKIIDELITNATDHSAREDSVNIIKINCDTKTGEISVYNNGPGIPVVIHKEHNVYVPELIFGNLMSGSNYNDDEQRIGSGTNGVGASCACIYSKKFTLETLDSENGLKYVQVFTNNMSNISKPKITKNSGKSYTKVTIEPDYEKFNMESLDEDSLMLIYKRVYDCIACTNERVSIFLNDEKLKGKGLKDYVKYFFDTEEITKHIYEINNDKNLVWEYIIIPWKSFEQISFVNGNSTFKGGKHVDFIINSISAKIKYQLDTKKKLKDVKTNMIKDKMFIFLRATIINPTFDSQTKGFLTTHVKDFGCRIELSDQFIDKIYKSQIVSEIVELCKLKESVELSKKTDGSKKIKIYIPKLEDALFAGTSKSNKCVLLLTEGDSAKTFCMWGRSAIKDGNNIYGIYPMRGKCLNVRDATNSQLLNNEELNNIKKIVGLKSNKDYKDTNDLRYGKIMLVTDADFDGSHITALFVNFIHTFYPGLIKLDFIQSLRTPIVKASKGKTIIEFFNEQDYSKWKLETLNYKTYNIKFFKGLGTSQKIDAKNSFAKIKDYSIDYFYKNEDCNNFLLLAFEKDKNTKSKDKSVVKWTDKRKIWLSNYDKNSYVQLSEHKVCYQDLINKELIHFSIYDNLRSIPSLYDGLKPSQRKILYYMLKRKNNNPIKVSQLSGYVSAEMEYHHGEVSLQQAIVNMAQDFIGTNNINLLFPDGNFGSRISDKDSASPRYIFTRLNELTPLIFNENDLDLLTYIEEDGKNVEPEWFVPVIPMVLVNGVQGIGTGFSTYIPSYNPLDIITVLKNIISDTPLSDCSLTPYFKGFNGTIEKGDDGMYSIKGKWIKINDTTINIIEIPVYTTITECKEYLESLMVENKTSKNNGILKDVINKTLDENSDVSIIVEFKSKEILSDFISKNTLEKELKLVKTIRVNNMHLFNNKLTPAKFKTPLDIIKEFYTTRYNLYIDRKKFMLNKLFVELQILKSKYRFIDGYMNNTLDINRKPKNVIVDMLVEHNFYKSEINNYDYLVNLPIISFSYEKIAELESHISSKQLDYDSLLIKTEKTLWLDDLSILEKKLKNRF